MVSQAAEFPRFDYSVYVSGILSLWVLAFIIADIKDKLKHHKGGLLSGLGKLTPSYWGMQIAHIGVIVCVMGVGGVSSMSIEKDVAMTVGDSVHVQGYDFYLQEFETIKGSNYDATQATITVKQNDRLISTLYPQKRNYVVSMMPMTEVGIRTGLLNEMYVALGEPITADNGQTDINTWAVRVYVKPMVRRIWLGAIIMALGAFIAIIDKRYRLSKVQSIRRNDTGAL